MKVNVPQNDTHMFFEWRIRTYKHNHSNRIWVYTHFHELHEHEHTWTQLTPHSHAQKDAQHHVPCTLSGKCNMCTHKMTHRTMWVDRSNREPDVQGVRTIEIHCRHMQTQVVTHRTTLVNRSARETSCETLGETVVQGARIASMGVHNMFEDICIANKTSNSHFSEG
jgi:hypothetical protein